MNESRNKRRPLPLPPFPTVGEIAYEFATRSGLVQTTDDKDPLYNALKAFKDDRKRPGLAPVEFPKNVLVDLEDRLAAFWNVEEDGAPGVVAFSTLGMVRFWFDFYAGFVATMDATLIERHQMVDQILWPTLFSAQASILLGVFAQWKPDVDVVPLLAADHPFAFYLRYLCKNGSKDFNAICTYRAGADPARPIDKENCRKTLDQWLTGKAVPNLARCQEILVALKIDGELRAKIWMLIARVLEKTPREYRALILARVQHPAGKDPREEAYLLMRKLGWEIATGLNIGPDRPYLKIRKALYEPDPTQPRTREHIIDMLGRQEKTWEPIADHTLGTIHRLWARFHVLCGDYEEGLERYKLAYDYGANRDPDIYNVAIHEAMVLAARMGEKRQVERFRGWIGLYSSFEWDEEQESVEACFDRIFPPDLRFTA